MKESPLRTTCGGGSFVLRSVREGQPSDPATTTSSDCGAGWMKDVADGAPCPGRCFAALGIEGDLVADPDGLEGYGCKREIVVGVVLFHKLIEAECHIDWNVQDLALFAEVLVT